MSQPRGRHEWTYASNSNVQEFYQKLSRKNSRQDCCVLLIGVTGSGKSSICKIMGCESAKIGHSAHSQTKENHLLSSNNSNLTKYTFIDTMGTEDSSNFSSSEEILKQILKKCFQDGVTYLKVIWTLTEEPIRARKELQTAAKFINSLDNNIWNCVLFIRRGGKDDDRIQGLKESIKLQGKTLSEYTIKNRYFGVTCIDKLFKPRNSDVRAYERCLKCHDDPNQDGLYTKKDYIKLLVKQLDKLEKIKLKWDIKKCLHCTEIGDPKFISSNCHYKEIRYHENFTKYHSGNSTWRHYGSWRGVEKSETYEEDSVYDDIKKQGGLAHIFWAHPGTHIVRAFQGSRTRTRRWTDWSWSCCENKTHSSSGCKNYCSNCNNEWSSTGCAYKCGNCYQKCDPTSNNNQGCKSKCSICNRQWKTSVCHQN